MQGKIWIGEYGMIGRGGDIFIRDIGEGCGGIIGGTLSIGITIFACSVVIRLVDYHDGATKL